MAKGGKGGAILDNPRVEEGLARCRIVRNEGGKMSAPRRERSAPH